MTAFWVALAAVALAFLLPPVRIAFFTRPLVSWLTRKKLVPRISPTERTAIEAGSVWIERDLFSGKPNFRRLVEETQPTLSFAERSFLDRQVNELCAMIDDWSLWEERQLPEKVWDYMKRERFLGLVIPREYGGLGFSPFAHSEVVRKIASRSQAASIYVMVPNSLGPAELILRYGTHDQKKQLLPRLARGDEIPCFSLTEPMAGSDAASIQAEGVLFKGHEGKLYLRLNWEKRWTSLASISTLIALAFQLKDPDGLLGGGKDVGITLALVPSDSAGVELGRRHDPLGVPFHNCPVVGKNVVVPADAIVGGVGSAGHGWAMLMECLAAGRGVSFPAQCTGGAQLITRVVSAHAVAREQFGMSIGRFEGVQELIARIAGESYMIDALRVYTLSGLTQGFSSGIAAAIAKHYSTEIYRDLVNRAMDVMGGAGISLGPRNLIAHSYIATPVGITVEGANVMTRSLMIFGQGALRAHPTAYAEIQALERGDAKAFDRLLRRHLASFLANAIRATALSLSRGWLSIPARAGGVARYYRKLAWCSASFAFLSDVAMLGYGSKLKKKEHLSGRLADVLAYLYIGTAVLRRFDADGAKKEHQPLVDLAMARVLDQIQHAFDGILANFDVPGVGWFFRRIVRGWSALNPVSRIVSDAEVSAAARMILEDDSERNFLTHGMFFPEEPPTGKTEQLIVLERARDAKLRAEGAERILNLAVRGGSIARELPFSEQIRVAAEKGMLTQFEAERLRTWERLRREAVEVDSFTEGEYLHHLGALDPTPTGAFRGEYPDVRAKALSY